MKIVKEIISNECNGWSRVQLKDVATYINSKIGTSDLLAKNYISTENMNVNRGGVVSSSNVPTNIKVNKFQKNDILFSNIRTYFKKLWRAEFDGGASNDVLIIRTRDIKKIKNSYLYYVLSQEDFFEHTIKTSKGTKMPRGDKEAIMKYEFFIPENIETQEKIASILSSLDDKIELNNQMNKTLEDMAQTIFKRWFIDFEFPNENGEPYKSSGGKMVESELGEIPEGWEVKNLSEIIEINPRETLKKGEKSIYIEMKSLSENHSLISNYIVRDFTGSGTKFKNRDTLMARITPCLENGKTGYINFLDNEVIAWGSTEFNILRSKNNIPKELSYFIARDDNFRKYAIVNMNGSSGRQRINGKILEEYRLPITNDFNLYLKFGFIVSEIMNKIENNRKEIQELTLIRDTLLPKLMNGEVEI